MTQSSIDENQFSRILKRNVAIPLVAGLVGMAVFLAIIFYLLSAFRWVEHTDEVLARANEAARLSSDSESTSRGYLLLGLPSLYEQFEATRDRLPQQLASLRDLVSDNPAQVARLRRMEALSSEYLQYAQQTMDLRRDRKEFTSVIETGRGPRISSELRSAFSEFLQIEQSLRSQRAKETDQTTVWSVAIYLLLSLVITTALGWIGRRELMRLSHAYSDTLAKQTDAAELLAQEAWLSKSEGDMSTALIGQTSLPAMGNAVLQFLSREIDAVAGTLYLRDSSGTLRRVASYGTTDAEGDDNTASEYRRGESLASQAVEQNRVIALSPVPVGYLRAASTLGSGEPASVLLMPLQNEGVVNGLVELGFFRPLQTRDTALLRRTANAIGSAIEASRYRERLQHVLGETQQLNEELQVQQEELRTANEELEEHSRALKESQATLESQQAELEQTNEQLSEQAQLLDARNLTLNAVQGDLKQRADELQQASQYKSEFLANMSHELRTPLNSSLILAKLLADNGKGNLDREQVKFAESIYSAGNDLLNLINDILDISKVEAGKLDVRLEETPLARVLTSLRGTFEPLAKQKGLSITVTAESGAPATLRTDPQRLEQILKNLLSNAIKFTDAGQVALTVSSGSGGRVLFAVRDSGIGIRADQQETVFEAFRQADGTTSRRHGGTGLGLSISRDLAGLLGGGIAVQSAPGAGSTFTLDIPVRHEDAEQPVSHAPAPRAVALSPAAASVPATPPALRAPMPASFADDRAQAPSPGRIALVIEDEPQFAHILYDLAHELGYRCLVAHTIEDGLALARKHLPQAILLDMRLPDGSGLSALQQLKVEPATRHIPVHVISVEDRSEAAMHLGAIGYAVKPATREQLKDVFGKLEAKLAQQMKRVLLVEDDEKLRESVVQLIGGPDVTITAVGLGGDALAQLRSNVFDCMVIDLSLPDMTGQDLLRRMSAEDMVSFPPVIVYTGRNLTRDEEAELLKYSRSIIIKGARSPERLLDEVTLFLHKIETQLSTEQQSMLRTARSRDKVFEGRRILLVDDDVRNIFALTSALEHKGALVEVGRNGYEAIAKLDEVADIDLVLMDIMMPEMDGLEAMRRIRKDGRFGKLPIIAVTAKAMKDDQDQCLAAGASDYLAKPIDLDRLFSLLRVWMPKLERI